MRQQTEIQKQIIELMEMIYGDSSEKLDSDTEIKIRIQVNALQWVLRLRELK